MSSSSEDLKEIKSRIIEDDKIEYLLEKLECENIRTEQGGQLVVAQLPPSFKSKNRRAVQIRVNENLSSNIRNRGFKGDIFGIVSIIENKVSIDGVQDDLYEAKKWIIETLGYYDMLGKKNGKRKSKVEQNGWLKEIKKKRSKIQKSEDVKPNTVISEDIKKKYIMLPYKGWIEEGIFWETQVYFEVGYDLLTDRVITMVHNKDGQLIGVKGRYIGDNEEILDNMKYLYIEKTNKSIELFNYHRAVEYIKKYKRVIVFEGYKSVMKCTQYGYPNCVSIEGDSITDVQLSLLKDLGIDVEIVIAFDKDKTKEDVVEQVERITNRKVYAVIDSDGSLKEKESPVDRGKEVFEHLVKNKIKIKVDNVFDV